MLCSSLGVTICSIACGLAAVWSEGCGFVFSEAARDRMEQKNGHLLTSYRTIHPPSKISHCTSILEVHIAKNVLWMRATLRCDGIILTGCVEALAAKRPPDLADTTSPPVLTQHTMDKAAQPPAYMYPPKQPCDEQSILTRIDVSIGHSTLSDLHRNTGSLLMKCHN